tara:strand:+ start:998 stop:1234 length:237 start_codon:yes stop_codon:yes gene_type:complete
MTDPKKSYSHDERHGGPYDRGKADAWYQRPRSPHYFHGDSYSTLMVSAVDMNVDELVSYHQGFNEMTESGNHKVQGGE